MSPDSSEKRILVIGGCGQVGRALVPALGGRYQVTVADISDTTHFPGVVFVPVDVADYDSLLNIGPEFDAFINLAGVTTESVGIVDSDTFSTMADVFVKGAYNIFLAASELGVSRVVFASSNHVTNCYEQEGHSTLGREITVEDYPCSLGPYGAMKLFGEVVGRAFSVERDLSVICLRIGTVRENDREYVSKNDRARRTILSNVDLANLVTRAIETDVKYGIYYGVSDNRGRPWSIRNAVEEIGYSPSVNSDDLLKSPNR